MTRRTHLAWAVLLAAATSACSTHPRSFKPNLAENPDNGDVFTRDLALCNLYVERGIRSGFAQKAALVTPGTAGTVILVGSAANAAVSNAVGAVFLQPGTASVGTLSVAAPIIGIGASMVAASAIKHGKEKKVKAAMTACLNEFGYAVKEWTPNTSGVIQLPETLPQDTPKPAAPQP